MISWIKHGFGQFLLVFLDVIFIVFILGYSFLRSIDFSGHLQSLSQSLAIKNIIRQKKTSLTLFTAMLLCVFLFSLIPQIGASLNKALSLSADKKPSFFVIDAKEEPCLQKTIWLLLHLAVFFLDELRKNRAPVL